MQAEAEQITEQLETLRGLSCKFTDAHVLGNGTARIVVNAHELYALEETIRILGRALRKMKGGD